MNGSATQEFLFQRIKEKLPPEASLADRIAELLHVSTDSAYRRIRGETPLVLEEARILCEAFRISLDQLFELEDKSVVFSLNTVNNGPGSFEKFLSGMHRNLSFLAASDQKQLIYLSKDLPIFHNFHFRPLFAFRYFFWMKSILQDRRFDNLKFSIDLLPTEVEKTGRDILQLYNNIPSLEIWNTECVNSTLAQIAYYREAGFFASDEDIQLIFKALSDTIDHIRGEAETGSKYLAGENPDMKKNNFEFFQNRIILGDNTILSIVRGKKTLFLNYEVLNYMQTQDEQLCLEVYNNLQTLIRRSTILSQVSEKQRNIFFNTLQRKIPNHYPSNALQS